jgi:hypothetical protein
VAEPQTGVGPPMKKYEAMLYQTLKSSVLCSGGRRTLCAIRSSSGDKGPHRHPAPGRRCTERAPTAADYPFLDPCGRCSR